MSVKKKLINEVFKKARKDSGRVTKNALSTYLSFLFAERFDFSISDRTLIRYFDKYVEETGDLRESRIDDEILDRFSEYLGFNNFENFANNGETVSDVFSEETFVKSFVNAKNDSDSKENIIHITIQNIIKVPEFLTKHKGMSLGVLGIILAGAGFTKFNQPEKIDTPETLISQNIETPQESKFSDNTQPKNGEAGIHYHTISQENKSDQALPKMMALESKNHMYWNGYRYVLTFIDDKNPSHNVVPADDVLVNYFQKIKRPDTLNPNNGIGKTWYSKHQNKVEFFTMDGKNPENHKELRPATEHILLKYAGENAEIVTE
ncbi:hypothetical protein [Chryseobacterium sp. Leaf394]|uniref:hypothetical protein n=1 Tax=Chryseobacterium sp. Leaf394 TaxID=1736361 RepID=UPI0006F52A4F|nr:hypothetical protein [Chryseobacterium sp. Leaf394]KQS92993.1 hypothetical protein ASG21_11325 [Chryseobacterium sp. Leaf394]